MLLDQLLRRGVEVGARLGRGDPEDLLDARDVVTGLFEVLGEGLRERLRLCAALERRQRLARELALEPERLPEQLQEEVARVAQLRRDTFSLLRVVAGAGPAFFAFSRSATRSASAMMISAGFAAPSVGKTLPSTT